MNQTDKSNLEKNFHYFQNYRWIHFMDMMYFEKKYMHIAMVLSKKH
jgi:hypothetical protein